MKKIIYIWICLLAITACNKKAGSSVETDTQNYFLLDEAKMEQIIVLMPVILKKSQEFQAIPQAQKLSDEMYNTALYEYIYQDKPFAERLNKAGFATAKDYQDFYNTMIGVYLFLLEQPDVVEVAKSIIIEHKNDIDALKIRLAKEPNNKGLQDRIARLTFELVNYQNIVTVSAYLDQLNKLNQ